MLSWVLLGVLLFVLLYVVANKDAIITEHMSFLDIKGAVQDQTDPVCGHFRFMKMFDPINYQKNLDVGNIPAVCLSDSPTAPDSAPAPAPDPEPAPDTSTAAPVAMDAGAPASTDERVSNIEAQMSTISARLGIPNPHGPPPADLVELSKKYNELAAELKDMREKSEKGMAQAKEAQDKLDAIATS